MSSSRHAHAKELFLAACACPAEERDALLGAACGDDVELRAEVEELLRFDEGPGDPAATEQQPPGTIPDYRFLRKLGEGGMGEVWEAEQERPLRRRVALKLIRWGMDTKEVVARFESERQALALMSHPNIARVFEAGATAEGRPFFAMELIRGVPITDYCDERRLTTEERLELFAQVCDGVQHAHHRGVIHRDVKPTNVLVAVEDGRPLPKIIDFGVAKATAQRLTERSLFTELGQWIGTPEYMSPEQAELSASDVDTRSDVYSLGVLLYELLVGARPFDPEELRRAGFDEMRRRIREEDPPRPSTRVSSLGDASQVAAERRRTDASGLVRRLRGDLDWIVMHALEKDRARRYGSPAELAADIARHLRDEPVLAGPPRAAYRVRKLVRRHRVGVAAALLVLLALLGGIAGTSVGLVKARDEAESAREVADLLVGMFQVMEPGSVLGGATSVEGLLEEGVVRIQAELGSQPLVQARLLDAMGRAYTGLGRFDRAELLIGQALALRRQHLGDDHVLVAASLESMGRSGFQRGDYERARGLYEQALAIRSTALGDHDPSLGSTLTNLGFVLYRLGLHERAKAVNARAVELLAAPPGAESAQLADALFFKQVNLHEELRYREAIEICERVLAIRETLFGPKHFSVGWALHDLGLLHDHAGDAETGRPFLERSLAVQTEALGPEHWATSYPLDRLADLESRQGQLERAGKHFEQALTIRRHALGEDHPEVALLLRRYGHHLRRIGQPERATELLERSLSRLEASLGREHPEVARSYQSLGYHLATLGDLGPAWDACRRGLEIRQAVLPAGHAALGASHYTLACIAARRRDRETALDHLKAVLATSWADPIILDDSDLDSLRGEPELAAVRAEIRRRLGMAPNPKE